MAKKITKKSLKKNVVHKNVSGKIITVKNADGDSDTKATILIQNRINYTPKVSVIIPVYNVEKYLPECLDSVISQTLKEIEIICVDDGSTDNSVNILKEYAKKDKRITVLRQTNLHAGVARNAGIAVAKGEYFSFLDSDDFFELDMLESLVKIAKKDKSDVVICGNYVFDQMENKDVRTTQYLEQFINKSPFNPKDIAADLFMMCNPNAWTKLFRSANIRKYNIRFEKFISCNDITFVCTNLALAEKISIINTPYVHYRVNTKINISSNRGDNAICLVLAVDKLIQNLKSYDVYDKFKDTLKQRLKSSFIWELKQCTEKQAVKLREEAKALFDQQLYDFVCGEKPKVSVIIPVYNVEKYLPQCLDSAINQSMKEIEIICVNDGSPDNSLAILQDYAKKDSRIKIINQKNQGLSASRNNALQIVRGEYVLFLDSDDWIDKDTCKDLYEYAKKFDLDMINFEGINYDSETGELNQLPAQKNPYVSESGVCFTKEQVDTFIDKIGISACRVFYKTDFIKKNNLQFPVGLCFEDNYFLLKALNLMQRYGVLHKILYYRRTHPGQITANWDKFFGDYINIIKKVDEMYHEIGIDKGVNYRKIINKYCCGAISRLNSFDVMNRNRYIKDLYKLLSKLSEKVEFDKPVLDFLKKVQKNEVYTGQLFDWYVRRTGSYLHLENPKTLNEKIQWLKMYNSTPIKTKLADKFLVRDWVKEKIGEQYLIPLLGVYDRFEDIDFSKLPDKFVIKCNHGCAYNIIVKDKSKLDLADVKEKLDMWLSENFAFKAGFELHYRDIPPKILIEQYMENSGSDALYDYKFWCFNGEVKYMQFRDDFSNNLKMVFYNLKWEKQPFYYDHPLYDKELEKPNNFEEMIKIAKLLCKDFPFVCVDLYRLNDGTIYFGEMTFTRSSGTGHWNDDKYNLMFGNMLKLPKLAYNADTERYYKITKKSKLKTYLFFVYYLVKLMAAKKLKKRLKDIEVINKLRAWRIDIKNHGSVDNNININVENAKVIKPAWFKNEQGQGAVIENSALTAHIKIMAIEPGTLRLTFRAPDRRYDGKRFPVYVDYTSIKIDGNELLKEPISAWHDKPFVYEMPVKDGQMVDVIITQRPHKYKAEELGELILKLNPNSDYIKQNITGITKRLGMYTEKKKDKKSQPQRNIKILKFCGLKFRVLDKHAEIMGVVQSMRDDMFEAIKLQNDRISSIDRSIQDMKRGMELSISNQTRKLSADIISVNSNVINSLNKSLADVLSDLDKSAKSLQNLFGSTVLMLSNNFVDALKQAADSMSYNFNVMLNDKIIDLNQSLDGKLKQNIEGLHNQLNILATEQSFLKETLDTALGNQISRVIKDLTSVSEFIQNLLKLNSDLSDSLTGLNSSFDDRLNAKYNRLIDRINFVSDLAHKILKNNSDLSDAIVGVNKNIGDGLLQNQQQIINSISSVSDLSQNILEYNKDLSDVISELNQKIEAGTDEHQKTLIENVNSITELIKQVLKYNFDLSKTISGINDSFKDQLNVNNNQLNECIHSVTGLTQKMSQNNSDILNAIAELDKQQSAIKNATEQTGAAIAEIQSGIANDLKSLPIEIETKQRNIAKLYSEPYWANIYHDTIINSTWLKDKSVSPGRWAVSYIVLYVLYRVLNEVKPASILECGLGQSSKLMVQYAQNNNADLIICENNPDWASFFEKNFPGADRYIKLLDVEMVEVVPPYKSRTYVGFKDAIKGKKFNMIMIDGPLGSERYSRPQILDVVDNLADSFVIMLDDMNRIGEQETWGLLKEKLVARGIKFVEKIYSSDKDLGVICSPDLEFLTSL